MQKDPPHSWRYKAKCMDVDTDIFYPPRDKALYKPIADKAKAICWGTGDNDPECPVRRECLWYAISMSDTHGIWGGMSHRERSHLERKFQRLKLKMSFRQYVMESDGGNKAKRFNKDLPRNQEGRNSNSRSNRATSTNTSEGHKQAPRHHPPV